MIPEATIRVLLAAAEVAGMPEGRAPFKRCSETESIDVDWTLSDTGSGAWLLQYAGEPDNLVHISTRALCDENALAILLEHLRRWLWEKHRVWVVPTKARWEARQAYPRGYIVVAAGPTYELCIASAVEAMKEKPDA